MKRQLGVLALAAAVFLSGCTPVRGAAAGGLHRYEASFLELFDTLTVIVGYDTQEEQFRQKAQQIYDELLEYHRLFDIYHSYEGMNNLKTVCDQAGGEAVQVDGKLIGLLLFCRQLCRETGGKVDVTMGSVLSLWHEARQAGVADPVGAALPDRAALEAAAGHTGFDRLEINEDASTLRLTDPEARLDVGAVAKGYAVEQVCRQAPGGLLVSVGGNVRATGPKPTGGTAWTVGIQDPDRPRGEYLRTVGIRDSAVVSSGDYQRYYTVDGVRYHHLIDPETLYPGRRWRAVTVLHSSSAVADALSTALFLSSREEGQALLERWGGQAMWVAADGTRSDSPGFPREAD